jgi:hypothetical protein
VLSSASARVASESERCLSKADHKAGGRPIYRVGRCGREWRKRNIEAREATGTADLSPSALLPFPLQEIVLIQARSARFPQYQPAAIWKNLGTPRHASAVLAVALAQRGALRGSALRKDYIDPQMSRLVHDVGLPVPRAPQEALKDSPFGVELIYVPAPALPGRCAAPRPACLACSGC